MASTADHLDDLPLGLLHEVDQLCERFEREWASEAPPAIDAYLAEASEAGRAPLLREILSLDLEYRENRGESPSLVEYAARLPDHVDLLCDVWAEYRGSRARRRRQLGAPIEDWAAPAADDGGRRFGDYVLLRKLGQGGMGIVFEARQVSLNRSVALKMIRAGEFADEGELRRFRNEAEIIARLDHPGIVPILEVGEHAGQHYYTMKLIEGGSLAERLDGYAADPREAARLLLAVAQAVHHAHQRGVLHRDLKPANILVDAEGRPHVTDFGLAKLAERDGGVTGSTAIVGSPSYMAPEQAQGDRRAITTATDVYGLGAVLYALLAGRAPFEGDSILETLDQVRERAPDPPTKINPRVPRDLEVICRTCLEKEPRRRYPSALGLSEDLRRWLAGLPIMARPVGTPTRLWMWCKRKPVLASLAAGLALALVLGFLGVATQWRRAEANLALANRANADLSDANASLREAQAAIRRTLYAARMNLIQSNWQSSKLSGVRDLLEQLRPARGEPDLRGFEWYYWNRLSRAELVNIADLDNHTSPVAYSPDGDRIASGDKAGVVGIWDAATGVPIFRLPGHEGEVRAVAYSPDGRRLASAGLDHRVMLWDAERGKHQRTIAVHDQPVTSLAFSPDGRRVVSASWDRTAKVYDIEAARVVLVLEGHHHYVRAVDYSRDGKWIATGSFDKRIKIWDAATGKERRTLEGHTDLVSGVAFSPDSHRLASTGLDKLVKLWDVETGAWIRNFRGHKHAAHGVAFSPDGGRLASASLDQTVKIWDAGTSEEVLTLKGHDGPVTGVAFSRKDRYVASAGDDGTLKVWDTLPGDRLFHQGHKDKLRDLAFSPDGRCVATAGDEGIVRFWHADRPGEAFGEIHTSGPIRCLAFGPGGRIAVDGPGTVRVYDAPTGRELLALAGDSDAGHGLGSSRDGRWIALGGKGGRVDVRDASTGGLLASLDGHTARIHCVAFGPAGRRVAAAGEDGRLTAWDLPTGRELFSVRGDPNDRELAALAFSPDGREIATAGRDRLIRLRDAETGAERRKPLKGHAGIVYDVAYSPDGRRLVSGGTDATVKLWDLETGNELLTLQDHLAAVLAVAFSPDGRRIASVGADCIVRIWDAGPLLPDHPPSAPH